MASSERVSLLPREIISEEPLYADVGWEPHGGQIKIIRSRERNRVVAAGRRFGKSEVGGHKLVHEAVNTQLALPILEDLGKRREFWIVGPSYTDSEKEFRVLYNRLKRMGMGDLFDHPGTYNDPNGGNMHISMYGGKFIVNAKSAQHPESLVGEGLSGAVLAEAAKLKEIVYTRFIRPTLSDFNGWCLMTSTPEGKNWFYEMWRRGRDSLYPDWWSMRAPAWMNPFVYPQGATDEKIIEWRRLFDQHRRGDHLGIDTEIVALLSDLTEEAFKQEIGAEFTTFVGRVFKEFDEEIHVGDLRYQPGWPTYAAVDYGYTNPSVWLLIQEDPHGEVINVLGEVYERNMAPDEFADEIKRRGLCPGGVISFYPDPASPGDTKILEEKLKIKARGGTGGEIKWRIDAIRKWLKWKHPHLPQDHEENRPKIIFDRSCTSSIADFLNYRYAQKRSDLTDDPENPLKKDDHAPEALGRYFAGKHGTADKVARRARQRRVEIRG